MSKLYQNIPSCKYYQHLPCEKPRECPVHRWPLLRPKKAIHRMMLGLHADFGFGDPRYFKTYCGVYLHRRYQIGAGLFGNDKLQMEGWTFPPIKSSDPTYEVFFMAGSSHHEVLVTTTGHTTCKRCMKHLDKGFQVPDKEYDRAGTSL